jgi:hypothetical protein
VQQRARRDLFQRHIRRDHHQFRAGHDDAAGEEKLDLTG